MEQVCDQSGGFRRLKRRLRKALKWFALGTVAMVLLCAITFALLWVLYPFPQEKLEQWSSSPAVLDVEGRTMLRLVGSDEQWRQPVSISDMSPWLTKATIAVEDSRFYRHRGVDGIAVMRAMGQNLSSGRVVSGASTLTMQICRMIDDRPRTLWAKAVESFRALQLERLMTKDEILELYLNIAPYGGNVRGVEAASRAYFSKSSRDLCLSEAALVAGLPQSPSRYRPDRHLTAAKTRQRVVLERMLAEGMITSSQFNEAVEAPIQIDEDTRAPRAVHAAWLALARRPSGGRTTIDLDIQDEVERIVRSHIPQIPADSEVAVVVIDIPAATIKAMVGSADPRNPVHGQVNGALASRSPGSTLKPFIYATAFEMHRLNAESLIEDSPFTLAGWTPKNFDKQFHGTITTAQALQQSLNIPAIRTAEGIGLGRCCAVINACGVRLPGDALTRGGLAVAVGAVETNLLDLTNAYATLGRNGIRQGPSLFVDTETRGIRVLRTDTCRCINDILSCRERAAHGCEDIPAEILPWFMWKTGTSSGRRDAWTIGHNYRYSVGVWVGRFRGTGRVDYVGARVAEPLFAEIITSSLLRNCLEPPKSEPLVVKRPLELTCSAEDLQITNPEDESVFACLGTEAVVTYSANREPGLKWFLNDQLIESDTGRLSIPVGRHTLCCVDTNGDSANASFTVVPTP